MTPGPGAALVRQLAADLRARAFAPTGHAPLVGAEVELIPVDRGSRRPAALRDTLRLVRAHAAARGWRECATDTGAPSFALPGGGRLTFEPGGQLEYSAGACRSASALLAALRAVVVPLRDDAAAYGLELLALGIDPLTPVEEAPMQLEGERYARMAAYLATIGPDGARMMRQTASVQLCVDTGPDPAGRWRLLNALAPVVVAAFANSPTYAGVDAGTPSARAAVWRRVDPLRTGVFPRVGARGGGGDVPDAAPDGVPDDASDDVPDDASDGAGGDPAAAYARFALAAPDMMRQTPDGEYLPSGEWARREGHDETRWRTHLTTLFPEVRPRGYFELRSCDALPPDWYAAPVAFVAGLALHPASASAALGILGEPSAEQLRRASACGLRDPAIARAARELVPLALDGCRALGPAFFAEADLDAADAFFSRYTVRGRAPADERGTGSWELGTGTAGKSGTGNREPA